MPIKIPVRKIPIQKIGELVKFDAESHSYLLSGRKFISVTTLVRKYKKPFDPDGKILFFCARKAGISTEEMQAQWNKKKDDACERGTNFHSQIENYIKSKGEIDADILNTIETECGRNQIEYLFPECRLVSQKYAVAGTSDLVHLFPDKSTVVYDWKTNKKFTTPQNQKYRDKMLFPINNLGDSDLEIYSLQLWCYALMLEEFGYPPRKNPAIFWLDENGKIKKFDCLNLKKEAETIMRHHYLSRNGL